MTPVLELKNITKHFTGVLANDHINLTLEKGEILGLLGENGAGKTTLMNILYGLYQPDEGQIFVNGKEIKVHSPNDAIAVGVGMVHQHFMLVQVFTVAENVMLGSEPTKFYEFLDRKQASDKILEISRTFGLEVNPKNYIKDLPVGIQQRVEIIKLLYRQAEILILDEPTAVLTPQEADELFKIMRNLADRGKSIIFITHKLREVLDCADRITVLRRGKVVGSTLPKDANQAMLASMMVGRPVMLEVKKSPAKPGVVALKVEHLEVTDDRRQVSIDDVSFEVRKGEILGIAGVQGNGQTELVEALAGLRPLVEGNFTIVDKQFGKNGTRPVPRWITEQGTAHIPEDRQRDGLVLPFPVMDNLVLCTYYLPPFAKNPQIRIGSFKFPFLPRVQIQWDLVRQNAIALIKQFDIRTPREDTLTSSLSGGNQQKVIVARELSRPIHLLIAAQPTRGLDVGSIEYIHAQIVKKRDEGVAVLLVSTELDEIMQLSDRIVVIFRGHIVATVPAKEATKEYIGLMMAGVPQEQALEQIRLSKKIPIKS
jgi:general nucleoside transport system ATP-binding protein